MKRIVSLLLIITVNALFLAHAVLPHHHHDGMPHFTFVDRGHHHGEEEGGCCCPVESNSCDEDCAFEKEIDVIIETDDRDGHCMVCGVLHDRMGQLVQAVLLPVFYDLFSPQEDVPDQLPLLYLISYQTEYVSQTLGLRAPPVS